MHHIHSSIQNSSTRVGYLKRITWSVVILLACLASTAQAQITQFESFEIVEYHFSYHGSSDTATISLYGSNDQIAFLFFKPVEDHADLPEAYKNMNDGSIRLYFKRERFASVIDLLQNESPLSLLFWEDQGTYYSQISAFGRRAAGEPEQPPVRGG